MLDNASMKSYLNYIRYKITLERYNRFVPNLTREDGRALLAADEKAKRSGPPKKNQEEYQ